MLRFWIVAITLLSPQFFVTALMGAETPKLTVKKVLDPNRIIEIKIDVPKADWDRARRQTRSFTNALGLKPGESPFSYVRGTVSIDGVVIKNVGIRKKGFFGSLDNERPSLKIRFDKYKEQNPIEGLDRLTLNNNKQDPSGMIQMMTYRFFNDAGSPAPMCNLAKVTVNGKYLGIYSNVESPGPAMLKRGFGDSSGALFEGTVTDFYPEFIDRFEKKTKNARYKLLRDVAEILGRKELDLKALEKLIDVQAFVRFWAIESLLGFWDGYTQNQNNYYVYQSPKNGKLYFLPWGADSLFADGMPLPPFRIRPRFLHSQALLPNRLYRIPSIQKLYHQTLNDLMKKHWDEKKLLAEVDRLEALLKPVIRKENNQFSRTVTRIRKFIEERRKLLTDEMKDGPVKLKTFAKRPMYFKKVGTARGELDTKWFTATPKNPMEVGKAQLELKLGTELIEIQNLGVHAEHSKWPPLPPGTPKPPTILFNGKRKSDGKSILLAVGLRIEHFQPGNGKPVPVEGLLFVGPIGFTTEMKMVGGEAVLNHAAMKEGARIQGKLTLEVRQMSGGKPVEPGK